MRQQRVRFVFVLVGDHRPDAQSRFPSSFKRQHRLIQCLDGSGVRLHSDSARPSIRANERGSCGHPSSCQQYSAQCESLTSVKEMLISGTMVSTQGIFVGG